MSRHDPARRRDPIYPGREGVGAPVRRLDGLKRRWPRAVKIGGVAFALLWAGRDMVGHWIAPYVDGEPTKTEQAPAGEIPETTETPVGQAVAPDPRTALPRAIAPATPPGSWISDDDYPAEAMRTGVHGITHVRLTVDPQGHLTRCAITASSGSRLLDDATCRLLQERARYWPAQDASGKLVEGQGDQSVKWQIPEG